MQSGRYAVQLQERSQCTAVVDTPRVLRRTSSFCLHSALMSSSLLYTTSMGKLHCRLSRNTCTSHTRPSQTTAETDSYLVTSTVYIEALSAVKISHCCCMCPAYAGALYLPLSGSTP